MTDEPTKPPSLREEIRGVPLDLDRIRRIDIDTEGDNLAQAVMAGLAFAGGTVFLLAGDGWIGIAAGLVLLALAAELGATWFVGRGGTTYLVIELDDGERHRLSQRDLTRNEWGELANLTLRAHSQGKA